MSIWQCSASHSSNILYILLAFGGLEFTQSRRIGHSAEDGHGVDSLDFSETQAGTRLKRVFESHIASDNTQPQNVFAFQNQDSPVVAKVVKMLKLHWKKRSNLLSQLSSRNEIINPFDFSFAVEPSIGHSSRKPSSLMTELFGESKILLNATSQAKLAGIRTQDITQTYDVIHGPQVGELQKVFEGQGLPTQIVYHGAPCGGEEVACETMAKLVVQSGFFDITKEMKMGPGVYATSNFDHAAAYTSAIGGVVFENILYGDNYQSYVQTTSALVVKDTPCLIPSKVFVLEQKDLEETDPDGIPLNAPRLFRTKGRGIRF